MKTSSASALIVLGILAAFLLGDWTAGVKLFSEESAVNTRTSSLTKAGRHSADAGNHDGKVRIKPGRYEIPENTVDAMSPKERVALLTKAASLGDPVKQSEVIRSLIPFLSGDELVEATRVLKLVQRRGNSWSSDVWSLLWYQWGKTDPKGYLNLAAEGEAGMTQNDARRLMEGWLETDPQGALAWVKEPKDRAHDAAVAAFAISSNAGGDIGKLETAILAVSDNKLITQQCLHDYFDLAVASGDKKIGDVYEEIAPALREAAWNVTMSRLAYGDPGEAAAWLEKHAGDPGADSQSMVGVISRMAAKDPAATTTWAAKLPLPEGDDPESGRTHPALIAVTRWMSRDPAAARAWLNSQPADIPWVSRVLKSNQGEP